MRNSREMHFEECTDVTTINDAFSIIFWTSCFQCVISTAVVSCAILWQPAHRKNLKIMPEKALWCKVLHQNNSTLLNMINTKT